MIYYTSDTHLSHNKEFIWQARGYASIEEHDAAIIRIWNETVTPADTVIRLGDVLMGHAEESIGLARQLNGYKLLVRGNHDIGKRRVELLKEAFEVVHDQWMIWQETTDGDLIYAHHDPAEPIQWGADDGLIKVKLCGHVHDKMALCPETGFINVGWDIWGRPVTLAEILSGCDRKQSQIPVQKTARELADSRL